MVEFIVSPQNLTGVTKETTDNCKKKNERVREAGFSSKGGILGNWTKS